MARIEKKRVESLKERKKERYQETEGRSVDDKQMVEKTIGSKEGGLKGLAERQRNIRKLKEERKKMDVKIQGGRSQKRRRYGRTRKEDCIGGDGMEMEWLIVALLG